MFLTRAVVSLFVSHENDVLILRGLSGHCCQVLYFHICEVLIWSSDLKFFVFVVDLQIFEMTFLAQRELKSLLSKESITSRRLNKVKPCSAGLFLMHLSLETPTPPPTPGRHGALDSWRKKKEQKASP